MEEQLIKFKTAKLAKDKGFNEICTHHYGVNEWIPKRRPEKGIKNSEIIEKSSPNGCVAPTQTILNKWLREKHNIYINIGLIEKEGFGYICSFKKDETIFQSKLGLYEEVLEEGLQEALELLKHENRI